MAHVSTPVSAAASQADMPKQHFALASLTTLFFMWGFITCLNDILIPYLKGMFSLNYTQAMLIQFCFFGAYFVMSIPAGKLVSRIGYQFGIVVGLDNRHSNLIQVASDLGIGWVHLRYLEVICE